MQRPEIRAGEIELSKPVGVRAQLGLLAGKVGDDDLAEGALGLRPLRRLLTLRILSERGAASVSVGAVLSDIGQVQSFGASAQSHAVTFNLTIPYEIFITSRREREPGDGLLVQLQLHRSAFLAGFGKRQGSGQVGSLRLVR